MKIFTFPWLFPGCEDWNYCVADMYFSIWLIYITSVVQTMPSNKWIITSACVLPCKFKGVDWLLEGKVMAVGSWPIISIWYQDKNVWTSNAEPSWHGAQTEWQLYFPDYLLNFLCVIGIFFMLSVLFLLLFLLFLPIIIINFLTVIK